MANRIRWAFTAAHPFRHGHASGVTLAVPGGAAGHLAVCCNASPGCRSVWYRPAL
jgi:hypothetical protein